MSDELPLTESAAQAERPALTTASSAVTATATAGGRWHFERYTLLTRLYNGPSGDVWRARPRSPVSQPHQTGSGEADTVLLKLPANEAGRQRLEREVEAWSRLVAPPEGIRPTLLPPVDVALGLAQPFAAFHDPHAPSLYARVYRRGAIPEAYVATMLADLLRAVAFAHQRGVVHGAITPGCVFVDSGYNAALADFGFGPIQGQRSPMEVGVATPEMLASRCLLPCSGEDGGWVPLDEFLAPEARKLGLFHHGSDLYAIGRVGAYALLGGPSRLSMDGQLARARVSLAMRRMLANLADEAPDGRYESADRAMRVVESVALNRTVHAGFRTLHAATEQEARLPKRQEKRLRGERPTATRNVRTAALLLGPLLLLGLPLLLLGKTWLGEPDTKPSEPPPREQPGEPEDEPDSGVRAPR